MKIELPFDIGDFLYAVTSACRDCPDDDDGCHRGCIHIHFTDDGRVWEPKIIQVVVYEIKICEEGVWVYTDNGEYEYNVNIFSSKKDADSEYNKRTVLFANAKPSDYWK